MEAYSRALNLLLEAIPAPLPGIRAPLREVAGLVLASPVYADMDVPPFDRAMVDGFAFRSVDAASLPVTLRIAGQIAAGVFPGQPCRPGEAWQIMTGAPVPDGADTVEMVEKVSRGRPDHVEITTNVRAGQNISQKGSEVQAGDLVLERGRRLDPAAMGVLAMFGRTEVEVHPAPSLLIATTGAELVDPADAPDRGQIRDSNLEMLTAAARQLGVQPRTCRIGDDLDSLRKLVREADQPGLLIICGGLSMGEYDYVARALELENARILFHRLPIRPGKPVLGAVRGALWIVGLPGNPVSSFVTFQLFARPAVRKLMGYPLWTLPAIRATTEDAVPAAGSRTFFAPAKTRWDGEGFRVRFLRTRGSADLVRFSRANSLLVIPAGENGFEAGTPMRVLLFGEEWHSKE